MPQGHTHLGVIHFWGPLQGVPFSACSKRDIEPKQSPFVCRAYCKTPCSLLQQCGGREGAAPRDRDQRAKGCTVLWRVESGCGRAVHSVGSPSRDSTAVALDVRRGNSLRRGFGDCLVGACNSGNSASKVGARSRRRREASLWRWSIWRAADPLERAKKRTRGRRARAQTEKMALKTLVGQSKR